ncbi:MAG: DNA polymerase zeta subunit [Linnemannia gamsii]|nr:MAG: DNA polymerase zeta subunit [Linnemannia gamsii]
MAPPGPLDLQTCQFLPPHIPVQKVPVIRIYGANEAGQKTCVHIHQVYPYFYVQYKGSLEPAEYQGYIHQLGVSLNHAAAISFNTPPQDLRKSQYVAAIILVKGIPFYGYHVGYSYFLKIYLFNPDFENRIVDLMRGGAVMRTEFQPFEAHVPFRLQFFIDYNLYGMGWLELEDALLRNHVPGDHPKRLTKESVMDTRIWSPENDPGRISSCEIEMDTTADRIINRDLAPERDTHFSLDECFKPPPSTAQVPSVAGLWEDDVRRRKANNLPSQEAPKTQIREPESIPWLNHDFNKRLVANMVKEMVQRQSQEKTPTQGDFDNYMTNEDPLAESLMTAYESIEFLCPRIETFKGLTGLGGIDEQDEDDEDFPLPDMDMGNFQEEDFMDGAEFWDEDFQGSDRDSADPASDDGLGYPTDNELDHHTEDGHIPQFDGGSDFPLGDGVGEKQETDEERWKRITIRSKRSRSTSSNLQAPGEQSPKAKRFRDLDASGGGSSNPSTPPILTRQRSRTAGASMTKLAVPTSQESLVIPPASFPSKPSSQDDASRRLSASFLKTLHGKYILDHVEIPQEEHASPSSHRSSQGHSKTSSPSKTAKPTPRLFQELPLESASSIRNLISPPSPRHNYFLSTLEDVWSSPSPPMTNPDFFFSPPRPRSPDLIPTHSTPNKLMSLSSSISRQTFASLSSSTPQTKYQFSIPPPALKSLMSSLPALGLPNRVHQKPYFSNEADVPSKAKVFGGKEFRLQSKGLKSMPQFKGQFDLKGNPRAGAGYQFWEPNMRPPSYGEALAWLKEDEERVKASLRSAAEVSTQQKRKKVSQIEGPTQKNPFGCKNTPTKVASSIAIEKDFLDVLSLEVHCQTRSGLLPDPKFDPILAVFYCWQTDRESLASNGWVPGFHVGIITYEGSGMLEKLALGPLGVSVEVTTDEKAMLNTVIDRVRQLDPDILAGYEVHNLSWGYLVDRYQQMFSMDMTKLISRIRPLKAPYLSKSAMEAQNSFNSRKNSGLKIVGRHVFNVWRLIRGEVALTNYGYCNVVFHVLQQRIPHYSFETLTKWWTDGSALHQSRVVKNYIHRVQYVLQLIESQELISRTSEFARVFGVDFFSVISRGSQYKVESLMVRLSKPENFIMISPSRAQVGGQRAAEVIPMVMEPESGFYEDPVVVLDFQSLYPSVMIAYNYCYSTCLGKLGGGTQLGVMKDYVVQDGILPLMQEHLQIAPNHVMYVNQEIRRSLLARMLSEILDTRVMVKKAMKEYPNNKSLLKLLDARQLSLKFIANVTYGYTCASFSGRMPGIEIADSIVLSARETLERSIRFVNENPKWNARVVYGDTDSMFVQLKGRTRQEAFEIGYDISETITRMNPRPVKLKFEKVYHPCFLVTKKRYVGSSYETPGQVEPIFDAKGIETIRRDGVPAVQKIMETCIKTMFRTQDLSLVKSYLVRQLGKILEGRIPVPDLMFGKEVKLGRYSEKGVPPPGAIVSARRMELDPRSEPQYGERVPYVVVYGDPSARLTDQVVEPKELLRNKDLRLNGEYYIRKHVIPSLERILQLAGADVKSWYDEMPRPKRRRGGKGFVSVGSRIDRYYQSQSCMVCSNLIVGKKSGSGKQSSLILDVCLECSSEQGRVKSIFTMQNRLSNAEKQFRATVNVCSSCCHETGTELVACESLECTVFWQRRRAQDAAVVAHHQTERVMRELEELDF